MRRYLVDFPPTKELVLLFNSDSGSRFPSSGSQEPSKYCNLERSLKEKQII